MNNTTQLQQDVDFSKITFLIADDKAFFRDMAHTALARAGAKDVKHATTIETALQLLNRHGQHIGCVICDWDMAPVGGLELLRMIRCKTLPKTPPRTAVVILTAKANSGAVQSAKAMDVNGFAVAPLSFEKLVKTISQAIVRTWTLQAPSVYAAVPRVEPTLVLPEAPAHAKRGVLLKQDSTVNGAAQGAAALKAFPRRAPELKNVHKCSLTDVQPGAILARDIMDERGHLLLKTGTVLKPSLLDRLSNVPHGESYVWIGEWDEPPAP